MTIVTGNASSGVTAAEFLPLVTLYLKFQINSAAALPVNAWHVSLTETSLTEST